MKFLLDTHVFLWFISGDARLTAQWRDTIRHPQHEIYLSVVSLWEAIIKYQLGKLPLPEPPESYLPTQRERHHIANLPLDEASVQHVGKLPLIHRDPFDRMLVCQAIEHKLTIIAVDEAFRSAPGTCLTEPLHPTVTRLRKESNCFCPIPVSRLWIGYASSASSC